MLEALERLECHYTWRPELDSTRSNIEELIKKIKKKIVKQPHRKAAHLATLGYLYTRTRVKDFGKARGNLKEAKRIDADIRRNRTEESDVSSEFVIRADLLHLKQLRRGRPVEPQEIESELQSLIKLWKDLNCKARVFGVKGVTFECFGPTKCDIAADAFAEASMIQSDNFNWLYGEASLRARCDRQSFGTRADEHQLQLWRRAEKIGKEKRVATLSFYANYAEAILFNNSNKRVQLAKKVSKGLLKMSREDKEKFSVEYVICLKVLGHLKTLLSKKRPFLEKLRRKLLVDARTVQSVSSDENFYLLLANEAFSRRNREEAIRLLEKGNARAGERGHIWICLKLVNLQAKSWKRQQVVDRYDSLRETFKVNNRDTATIEFQKALYLMSIGDTKEAVESCIAAFEADSELSSVREFMKKNFLRELKERAEGFEEYLAWCSVNIGTFDQQLESPESLYQTALSRDEHNHFAREHLGRYYMKQNRFDEAADCFRKLTDVSEHMVKLLADALLKDPNADLKKLQECLDCGCIDAAPRILDILEKRKANQNTARIVMDNASAPRQTRQEADWLFFSTQLYELCAKIVVKQKDSGSFSLREDFDRIGLDGFHEAVRCRIANLLELKKPTSKSVTDKAEGRDDDRGSLMRSNRLRMTKRHLKLATETENTEMKNLIILILKEAKEVLDRSLDSFLRTIGEESKPRKSDKKAKANTVWSSYPHAFDEMKGSLKSDADYNKKLARFDAVKDLTILKKFEMDSLIRLLKDTNDFVNRENVEKCLQPAVSRIDCNFHQNRSTRDVFAFMVSREHRILSQEDCWLIRWIYLANAEKHSMEIRVAELVEMLRSDWSGDGECSRTAYELAHLAAEFAEETWAVLCGDSEGAEASGREAVLGAGVEAPTSDSSREQ